MSTPLSTESVSHLTAACAAYAALLRIKAAADDAAASLSAAIISTQSSKTRSFDGLALNAQAQCALVTLEALASATACCARRSANGYVDPSAGGWSAGCNTAAAQRREAFERDLAASTAAVAAENDRATRAATALKEHNRLECAAAHHAAGEAAAALSKRCAAVIDMDPANTYTVRIETQDRAALNDLLGCEVGCTISAYEFEAPR